ncbi:MAG: GspE/PulE family protein [Planctomycetaceae bacterium]
MTSEYEMSSTMTALGLDASRSLSVHRPYRLKQRSVQPLGQRMIEAGLLKAEELNTALSHQSLQGKRLGELVAELGLVDEARLLPLLGDQLGVAGVRLREGLIDPVAVAMVPRSIAERLAALPLICVHQELTVAMADPDDLDSIDVLRRVSGKRIRPVFALRSSIQRLITRCYEDNFSVDAVTADMDAESLEVNSSSIDLDAANDLHLAEGSPVINLVNYAIIQAVRQGVSDIHIEPGSKHTSVRFRIDGELREVMKPRRDLHPAIVSRVKVMAKLDIAEHRQPQDGRLQVRIERRDIDLRISTLPTVLGEKIVMRVLDRQNVTFDLASLGFPSDSLACFRRMLTRPHGLVLVTGPTGSGKTTTLYSAIELVKGVERNIVTVEDPVEYQLPMINQVQVSSDNGLGFSAALRSILRQDPDVIMVGEIRDRETAETAIQAALTGHLVLSTLHTNDSASAVTRLVDMGVEPFKIAAAVVGVVAQRLVRAVCKSCREPFYPPAVLLRELDYHGDTRRQFSRGVGCPHCFESGYRGRSGVYELLEVDAAMRTLICRSAELEAIRSQHRACGGRTLVQEALRLAEQGITSIDEVTRLAIG